MISFSGFFFKHFDIGDMVLFSLFSIALTKFRVELKSKADKDELKAEIKEGVSKEVNVINCKLDQIMDMFKLTLKD